MSSLIELRYALDPSWWESHPREAAAHLAEVLGMCRLGEVDLGDEDGSLTEEMALDALAVWTNRVKEDTDTALDAKKYLDDEVYGPVDLACDLISNRMRAWAALVAIEEAAEPDMAAGMAALKEAIAAYDDALRQRAWLWQYVRGLPYLDNLWNGVRGRYRDVRPWFLTYQ